MDAETIKGLRQAENRLALPLVAPELIDDSEFELSDTDIRLGLIQRVGEMSLSGEVGVDSVLSRQERSHLQFLYNLEDYVVQYRNGNGDSQLREHQHDVFDDIYNFLAQPKVDEAGEIQRRGYIELPTGSGKTAIFSTLVNVLNRPLPETDKKPKALVLVPKLDLVTQTVGIDGRRGFAQFASDTEVTEYHGTKKDLSGDAVVMSYQSLIKAVERGDVTEEDFDLIICDEAHRALGDRTRIAVETIANGNLMIGLTASPEFRSKHVKDLFPEQIHSMELREAIEMNLLSPVRCFAVTSDAEIETLKSGEFSEKELAQIIENEWRNRKTVEFVKAFVQEGKAGIVSCIPGEDTKHAQDIADAINQEFIEDPVTGELRRIKALAVSGTSENRQDIYEAFERGEIDVLTYVDVLTEGWDSTRAKFLVNLRPTTSPVNAIQRLGRVLRKAEDPEEIATVVEFIDKTEKPLYTFFHVLGEETIEQGKRFGKPRNITGGDLEGPDDEDRDTDVNLELPQELIDKLAEINHINIRELVVQPEVIAVAENPDEWLSIPMLTELTGIAQSTIKGLLEKLEIETAYIRRTTKPAPHVTFENAQILLDYIANNSERPDGYLNAIEIAREYKVNNHRVMNVIKELELEGHEYRSEGGRRFVAYSPEQISEVISKVGVVSEAPDGWLSAAGIAKALGGVNTKGVNDALEFFGYKGEKMRRGSKHTMYFSPDQVEQVRDFYVTMKPPEGWVPKSKVAEFLGVTKGQAQQRIDDAGVIGGTFPYKAGQQSIYYRPEDLEKLK